MKTNYLFPAILIALMTTHTMANASTASLKEQREQVVHAYVNYLGKADYQNITKLFDASGTVMSTSRGSANAQEFFYAFLPNVESSATEFHQAFASTTDNNRLAARFHYNFKLTDGEVGSGEYVDEFIFANNSAKLSKVYMFENLKFIQEND